MYWFPRKLREKIANSKLPKWLHIKELKKSVKGRFPDLKIYWEYNKSYVQRNKSESESKSEMVLRIKSI